jgi:NAD(P)-dependent dehydrogenase (short-subunit alcohol dehydrogenase family)
LTDLWAVVNNAGIAAFTEIEWCSVDQFQRILDVNVLGVVRVTKAFLPLLRHSKGRVVNVASLAGQNYMYNEVSIKYM